MPEVFQLPRIQQQVPAAIEQPAPPLRAVVGHADDDMRFILRNLDVMAGGAVTDAEMRRGYAMIAAHHTSPQRVKTTILSLDRPYMVAPPAGMMVCADCRRAALAAMLGIAVGFEGATARRLIDQARERRPADVIPFMLSEAAVLALTGGGLYGAYMVAGRGVAGVGTNLNAIHAGGLGLGGTLEASAAALGWAALTAAAGLFGFGVGVAGYNELFEIAIDHRDLLEPKFFKDQRILYGLQQGQFHLPNLAPDPRLG